MTKDEALRLALEALEDLARYEHPQTMIQIRKKDGGSIVTMYPHKVASDAITAIKAALEAKDEPFGYFRYELRLDAWVQSRDSKQGTAFYTALPQRKPLTDEEIVLIVAECAASHQHTDIHFARAIEAAHGIKGEA